MVKQNILPFKLEISNDEITPHSGLILQGEFMYGLRLPQKLDRELPGPGSAVGYQPSEYVLPLLLMLLGGGRSIEDLRELRADAGLCEALKLESFPSTDAVGDWLRRSGSNGGLAGLARVNRKIIARAFGRGARGVHAGH
jgi:hypothetical protein